MAGLLSRAFARRGGTHLLADLHTRHLDTIAGYDKILEIGEPEFRHIASDFRALHDRQARAIAAMLIEDGYASVPGGSIFGRLNRAVVTVRAWFDDISTNMLDAVVEGEKHVLDAVDAAIEAVPDAERRRILAESRAELVALVDRHAGPGRQ